MNEKVNESMEKTHTIGINHTGKMAKLPNMNEMFTELKNENPENEVITDLFYKSIKSVFDLGFQLANKLSFELIEESVKNTEDK